MTELDFAKKIHEAGGAAYLVGGAVRDKFRGVEAHDKDYCVTGVDEKIFVAAFPKAAKFGKSFPVYAVEIDGKFCEVAFARTEKKIGTGYRGFEISFSPSVTIEQDLFRRDTTINAMAIELLSGKLVDPFGGREDVLNKKIRAVSKHFTDDPVRALRAARQAAQFNFEICAETIAAMKLCGAELAHEPTERIFDELETALKTDRPSIFFRSLERAELLEIIFPEIYQLRGKIQPTHFHPEGDAYEHTLKIVDEVSAVNPKPMVRFAALMHDIGKGTTPPEMLPHHYKHEKRGLEVLEQMNRRMTLP
ncbi:MAG: HD domain-containing protein, partial [Selenomonadaceae bacterium]|nr:HD domain-containing protein [Selenomonadaceae bacterium]